ncbi:hypothetical protein ACSBLW_14330 [Thioclava sp. FR2]|uniref:O-linked N-acetylglucosamine transferase family protein n=1 Tax=Thioclava sp. FR2 TaxID=3445780 RepID=UPI003EC0B7AD
MQATSSVTFADCPADSSVLPVGFDRPATLHIVTPEAGLIRWQSVLLQVMRVLPLERHVVLFTSPFKDKQALSHIAAAGGFVIQGPDNVTEAGYWQWVAGRVDLLLPQRVMVHSAPTDQVAVAAAKRLARRMGKRLYLLHGQTTQGAIVPGFIDPEFADALHILGPAVSKPMLRRAMSDCGIAVKPRLAELGLIFDPENNPSTSDYSVQRPVLGGLDARGVMKSFRRLAKRLAETGQQISLSDPFGRNLTTSTSCSSDDLDLIGIDWLADFILEVVKATNGRHIHIGPSDPRLGQAVQVRLKEVDLNTDRVVFVSEEGAVANILRHFGVNVFFGNLPGISHSMGFCAAAWSRVAIARFTGDGAENLGLLGTIDWSDVSVLAELLRKGFTAPDLSQRGDQARDWYERRCSAERFARRLKAVLDVTEGRLSGNVSEEETVSAFNRLFDADYYLSRYPDIAKAKIDPRRHYRDNGEREGRSPNPLFSPWHYRAQLPKGTVGEKASLLAHYLRYGEKRGLTPHPYFVPACAENALSRLENHSQKIKAEQASVLERYLEAGSVAIQPHPLFDPKHYARARGFDADTTPHLLHYLTVGCKAGLSPHPLIRPEIVRDWGANDILEGLLYWLGKPEASPSEPSPDPLHDPAHLCGEDAKRYRWAAPNTLWAHLIEGNRLDRGTHALIDPSFVSERRPETCISMRSLLLDLAEGKLSRVDTHPLVSASHILSQAPWCSDHPTRHYVLKGNEENIDPHPWFSTAFYLSQSEEARAKSANALVHYLVKGQFDGLLPHPFFDGNDYWQRYLKSREGGSPLLHYAAVGAGVFRTVQPHDPALRNSMLRMVEALVQQSDDDQAKIMLAEAIHPSTAAPHPTLAVEVRRALDKAPESMDLQPALGGSSVSLTRPAVVAHGHIAPSPPKFDVPEIRVGMCRRATVAGGADGIGTQDGGWWPIGPEQGPLPGSELARLGAFAVRPQTAVAARRNDAVLLRSHVSGQSFGEAIFACGSSDDRLDHFLLEVLPRAILAAQIAPADVPVLTEADIPRQALQALRMTFPDRAIIRVPRGSTAVVDRLYVSEAVNRLEEAAADVTARSKATPAAVRIHPESLALLRDRLRTAGRSVPARRLFLAAEGLSSRRLLNLEEIGDELARCGFLQRDPAKLDFAELLALVCDAEEIVATDCPQLAVLGVARPGTRVWVLHGNAPGTDFHRWDVIGRIAGLEMTAVSGWQLPGSAGVNLKPVEAHYSVPSSLVVPFFDTRWPQETKLGRILDRLYGASFEADVLTGAWAVRAGPTPLGFEDRLRHLRRSAALALEGAGGEEIEEVFDHAFFTDFGRNLRSGFPVLGGFEAAEAALAGRVAAALEQVAEGSEGLDAVFAGPVGLRRLVMLGMVLLPAWQVPLPKPHEALPEAVLERWIFWAMSPPALIGAGEDAAWVSHVERLLDWLADRLDPAAEPAVSAALSLRLSRMAGRIDLGQLFLVDESLRGVQRARNRVLSRVALREDFEVPSSRLIGPSSGERRIRVGVLCRTFEKGPDSEAVLTFFNGFDASRFEIFGYSIGFRDRVVSKDPGFDRQFDAVVPNRRDLPGDAAGIRAALLADDLDVFLYANATTYGLQPMDLALFHRVAPLQIVLNSHVPMPMGYPSFDAVITGQSDHSDHEVPQEDFSETLIRLPGPVINYLTTLEPRPNPPLDRAALGLSADDVVLMNAGSSMKLRHETLVTMMRATRDIPNGVLLLAPYNPGWAARSMAFVFNRQVAQTAAETGLDPSRIHILGELSVAEAEAALGCADIYLNPFPHGGATMTHLALVHGIPPITLRRRSTRSIDQFLTETHGFAELLTDTPEDYIALATALGTDHDRRNDLKSRLKAAAKNPGFVNNPIFSKNMESAIEGLVKAKSGLVKDPKR